MTTKKEKPSTAASKIYPFDYSDKELKDNIKNRSGSRPLNSTDRIQLGLDELKNRQSKRYMVGSFVIAGVSLIISFFAVYMAISSLRSSSEWKDSQLILIEQLIEETKAQTEKQISIESHLAMMKEMDQTASKESQQLNTNIESIKQNVEILQRNMGKHEEPAPQRKSLPPQSGEKTEE